MADEFAVRTPLGTAPEVDARIRRRTTDGLAYHAEHPERIDERLEELDREWDIERALLAGASLLSLAGFSLTLRLGRRWLLLPLAVHGFFLQHVIQGWSPPWSLLRRIGYRTPLEIERERYGLERLRAEQRSPPRATSARAPVRATAPTAEMPRSASGRTKTRRRSKPPKVSEDTGVRPRRRASQRKKSEE